MNEMTNVLVSSNLLSIVRHWAVFWLILINPFPPYSFTSIDLIWQLLEEECVLIGEFMLGECLQVKPSLLLHPVEWFGTVIDTTTSFQ